MEEKSKRIIKVIVCIIIVLILLFCISLGRKMIIISKLSKNAEEYTQLNNYHVTEYVSYEDSGKVSITNTFVKDEKIKIESVEIENGVVTKTVAYGTKKDDNVYNMTDYIEKNNKKVILKNVELTIDGSVVSNLCYTANFFDLIKSSFKSSIKSFDNEYRIDNLKNDKVSIDQSEMYFEKDTGLVKFFRNSNGEVSKNTYEFNVVSDENFTEPDASEYEVISVEEYVKGNL